MSTLDGLEEATDVEEVGSSLVVAGCTNVDVQLAESTVRQGLERELSCLRAEEEHVLQR